MGVLESKLVITAVDQTAAAFASAEAHVHSLERAMSGSAGRVGAVSAAAARVGATESAIRSSGAAMGMIASAASSAASLALTIGGAEAVRHAVRAVAARQHELVRMAVAGMNQSEINDATTEAANLATKTPNIGTTETLHMLRNARSIVGSYREAAEIMEPMMKLRTLAQLARPGQDVSEDFDMLIKGLEIKGVTQDPKRFYEYMQGIAKGINVFGDTLKPYQYYEMFKYGRAATAGLSEKFILSTAPTLAQELGGSSYGNAVSAFNKAIVGGQMDHKPLKELVRLGLVDRADVDWNKNGDAKGLLPGRSVKGWQTAQSDPNAWVKDYLLPAFDRMGLKDSAQALKEVSSLFSNKIAAQMVSLLATQQARIDKDAALIQGAPGLEAADRALRADPSLAFEALTSSIEGLTAAVLQSVNAASGMTTAAMAIAKFTAGLEEEKNAQNRGLPSPGIARDNGKLNRLIFGVDTSDTAAAKRLYDQAEDDVGFGREAHDIVTKAEAAAARAADGSLSGAARATARGELAHLRTLAAEERDEWHNRVSLRGEDDYSQRLAADGMYGRGHVARVTPKLEDYIARAQQAADTRAFGAAPQHVDVSGQATVQTNVTVTASSDLISIVNAAKSVSAQMALNPVAGGHDGRMDSDAAPLARGALGRR